GGLERIDRAYRGLAVERLSELEEQIVTRGDGGDVDGRLCTAGGRGSLGAAWSGRRGTGPVAWLPRAGNSCEADSPVASAEPRRARPNPRQKGAKPRRCRICSLRTGAVRQFTLSTGGVGAVRRASPKSEAPLALSVRVPAHRVQRVPQGTRAHRGMRYVR